MEKKEIVISQYEEYCLVHWPDVQEYQEEDWFNEEAILHIDEPSAYFIPKNRIINK